MTKKPILVFAMVLVAFSAAKASTNAFQFIELSFSAFIEIKTYEYFFMII